MHRRHVDQVSPGTVRLEECLLRHALEWARERPFEEAHRIKPRFSEYLGSARLDGKSEPLSSEYLRKIVGVTKRLFCWLKSNERGYGAVPSAWITALRPPRFGSYPRQFKAVTLEEARRMATAEASLLWELRIQAAAAFLFLSGLRVGAFVSLPLRAVKLDSREIRQWPNLGVQTKFAKHATTFLLDIPELHSVVLAWDELVRSVLSEDGYWFAPLNALKGGFDTEARHVGQHRHVRVRKDLKRWLSSVNLPYRSPHQFRHGHAVYALTHAHDVADLKAVSLNLMHSNLSVTDGVYGIMSERDVSKRIRRLGIIDPTEEQVDAKLQDRVNRLEEVLIALLDRPD